MENNAGNKERYKERYNYLKSIGNCTICAKEKAMVGSSICDKCSEKRAYMDSLRKFKPGFKEKQNENQRNLRKKRLEEGKCTSCGGKLTDKQFRTCRSCREYHKNNRMNRRELSKMSVREERSYFNLCRTCGSDNLVEGKKLCNKCYERSIKNIEYARSFIDRENHILRLEHKSMFINKK